MSMKAGIVKEFGKTLAIETTEKPNPGKYQALVKLISSGVCHTDLHAMEGDWPVKPSPPFIPGHEGIGVVEELGEDTVNFEVGDMASNAWLWSTCGNCKYCRTVGKRSATNKLTVGTLLMGLLGVHAY